jgi:hypothetical protein
MYRPLALTAQVHNEPKKARGAIIAAFKRAACNRETTAIVLKISKRSLSRYIELLEMTEELDALESKAIRDGWHHGSVGGRPLGAKDGELTGRAQRKTLRESLMKMGCSESEARTLVKLPLSKVNARLRAMRHKAA